MKRISLPIDGMRYKFREMDLKVFGLLIVISGLLEYYRALSAGLSAQKHSFFDMFLWNMGNPVNLVFVQTLIFLFMVSKVIIFGSEDIYFIVHKKTKTKVWITNISAMIMLTCICAAAFLVTALLLSLNHNIFQLEMTFFLQNNFDRLDPQLNFGLTDMFISLIGNTSAFFICIGLFYYFFLHGTGKKNAALVCVFVLVSIDYIIYLCKIRMFEKFTLLSNVLPVYSETRINSRINIVYWGCIGLILCFFTFLMTRYSSIVREKKYFPSWMVSTKNIFQYYYKRNILYVTVVGIVYFFLAKKYIGLSENGYCETLALYFAGSDHLDVKLLLWIFLELLITLYITNFIYNNQKYNAYHRILLLKSKKNYFKYLAGMVMLGAIFMSAAIIFITALFLFLCQSSLIIDSRAVLYSGKDFLFFLINYVFGLAAFSLWVCIANGYFKKFSFSYLVILVSQLTAITIYNVFGGIFKYLPLIHGCTFIFSSEFTWKFALIYQILEVTLLLIIYRRDMKNRFEAFI